MERQQLGKPGCAGSSGCSQVFRYYPEHVACPGPWSCTNSVVLTVSVSQRWGSKIMQLSYLLVLAVVLSGELGRYLDTHPPWCSEFKGKKISLPSFQLKCLGISEKCTRMQKISVYVMGAESKQ